MYSLISVIVPVYNADKYLSDCIESITRQTYPNFELILIDDGSTDTSGEICDDYALKDSRIRVLHQKNEGVSKARHKGVENADGEYLTFVDADDELCVDSLEILMNKMDEGVDIVISDAFANITISSDVFIKYILTGQIFCHVWGHLFRRSLFVSYVADIPASIIIGEDELMNIKLTLGRDIKIKCIAENIYIYRYNPGSVTNTKKNSLEYEELFMNELVKVLGEDKNKFRDELYYSKLKTLENLIVCRVVVPYNRPWIKELISFYKGQRLGLRQWIVLNVRNNLLCKYLLAIEKRVRNLIVSVK